MLDAAIRRNDGGISLGKADENRATWQQVLRFASECPDNEYWNKWNSIMRPLISGAIELGYDSLFRAGTSMSHVILSNLDHHGLRDEPRVTLEVFKDWTVRISLTRNNVWFSNPTQFAIVDPSSALQTLRRYLWHLWEETVPEPIPDVLRE